MLDRSLKEQLRTHLSNLREEIELVAALDDSERSARMRELLEEIAELSDKVIARFDGEDKRRPSFIIRRVSDPSRWVRFAGLPLGHEFTSLVLALLWAGGHPPKVEQDVLDQIAAIEGGHDFEMYFSLSCHNCPDVVQALTLMALYNPHITATLIEGGAFQQEAEERGVMAVPAVFHNGEMFASGKMGVEEIIARLDSGAAARTAERLAQRTSDDVLILGGGPAAAAAAIYTVRKGFATALAAERLGGQLNDTLGIENFISTAYTEGPKLAAQLENHMREYPIDILRAQKATRLQPAGEEGGYHAVEFENGAILEARSIILATGARWRNLGVPGEFEYRNRGVAYCPHCDGPLYKGKRVAVVGGGNSGVEAAIDLANIVRHVTLIEFLDELRADKILQDKLRSMPNVTIITSAQTTEIRGDGERVTGLVYKDRNSSEVHVVELEGVFVQIGLVPNTEWLEGSGVERNRFGEIVVNERAATNIPGIFAAGDCTTVPYKQIVIAMGEGAKAGLSAFDYLIRHDRPTLAQATGKQA